MKEYIVVMKEVWDQPVKVMAESKDAALAAVEAGEGEYLDLGFEYNCTLESDSWNVEESEK